MARRRPRGLRRRIMVAFIGGALGVSALVAGSTYYLADRYLVNQRIEAATEQSFSNIAFAVRYVEPEQASLAELAGLLEARGSFDVLLMKGEQWFPSTLSITQRSVPAPVLEEVRRGQVAYRFQRDEPFLVFGSPIPGSDITAFFFYPVREVAEALALLWKVLLMVSLGAVMLAAIAAVRVSRRVVHPVRLASDAARRVAEGLLATRLPVAERDEIGTMAHSFNEMAAALEERIARERRFVGDVSHELRTPLTTLRASADYLLERADELPEQHVRAVELLSADLDYLRRLVDDLLDISRLESGPIQLSLEPLNVGDLVREVVAQRSRVADGEVRVEVDGGGDSLTTLADKRRLERVVGNLVDNALTHGGLPVTVRVGAANGTITLAVEDRGPGIGGRDLPRIFDRFYKADPSRPRLDGRGSGLGLAFAQENAKLHGGEIEVESSPGAGATFLFRLPRVSRTGT
ncbi:MAG TPA: HAMP domain-containing sensor histidine kinase [Actinomycetota bacterium]